MSSIYSLVGSQVTAGRLLLEADTSESDDPNGYPLLPRSDTRLLSTTRQVREHREAQRLAWTLD